MEEDMWVCVPHTPSPEVVRIKRINRLLAGCEGLTAPRAYAMLVGVSGPNEVVWPLRGKPGGLKREVDLKTFVKGDDVSWCLAKSVRFKFWGGPPSSLTYYNGTLETLLKDRVLDSIHSIGLDAMEAKFDIREKQCSLS